jgi:rare lipoprotein A
MMNVREGRRAFIPVIGQIALCVVATLFGRELPAKTAGKPVQSGLASFFDDDLQGKKTASGRRYDPDKYVAAHPSYPPGTRVRVTNLANGRTVTVRVIDRGPSRSNRREGVVIGLSRRAAEQLRFTGDGRAEVRTEVAQWGERR